MGPLASVGEWAGLLASTVVAVVLTRRAWTARRAPRFERTRIDCPWHERRFECTVLRRGRAGPILTVTDCDGAPGTGGPACDRACLVGQVPTDEELKAADL